MTLQKQNKKHGVIHTIVTPQLSSTYDWFLIIRYSNGYNWVRLGDTLTLLCLREGELWGVSRFECGK